MPGEGMYYGIPEWVYHTVWRRPYARPGFIRGMYYGIPEWVYHTVWRRPYARPGFIGACITGYPNGYNNVKDYFILREI